MTSTIEAIRFNGRIYKREGGRWFIDSRKRWRPVFDPARVASLEDFVNEGLLS